MEPWRARTNKKMAVSFKATHQWTVQTWSNNTAALPIATKTNCSQKSGSGLAAVGGYTSRWGRLGGVTLWKKAVIMGKSDGVCDLHLAVESCAVLERHMPETNENKAFIGLTSHIFFSPIIHVQKTPNRSDFTLNKSFKNMCVLSSFHTSGNT